MNIHTKILISLLLLILYSFYLIYNSNYYRMTQLDHLNDRIRFGRLEYWKKTDTSVGNINVNNNNKKFNITFKGQQIFVGQNQHFLILIQAKGKIQSHGDSFFDITDQNQKICKIQKIQNIFPQLQTNTIRITGNFQDCKNSDYTILLTQQSDNKLSISVEAPQNFQRIHTLFNYHIDSHYYGLGQQFSYLNLGHDRPYSTFVRQKGVGRGQQPLTILANIVHGAGGSYYTSYAPMPIWFSSRKVGYVLNDYSYMAWINNRMVVWNNKYELKLIKAESYKQVVKQIAQINGYCQQIPFWVNQGAIVGLQGGTQQVLQKVKLLKQADTKISGVWLQDWVSKRESLGFSRLWWNWQLDKMHYPNWQHMRMQLQKDNIFILIYINPMLVNPINKTYLNDNYYKIAEQNHYFVKLNNGDNLRTKAVSDFEASLIDFENEKSIQFFKGIISKALNNTSAKGMMVDFAQAYPAEQIAQTIQQGASKHNRYPTLYHKQVNRIIKEIKGEYNDFYIFTRAGYLHSPKYAHSLWAGDQSMNFNFHTGLPSCLTAILSSGLVGYSNTHCDIGGYTQIASSYIQISNRTEILMIRWMQLSAFTSVFRSHEGNMPDTSLQVYSNQLLIQNFAFYSNIFSILSQYRKNQTQISTSQKLPLVRPLFLQLQGAEGTQYIQDQFYLGEQIMAAPFMNQKSQRKYYLPKGEWLSIWDGKILKGCNCQRIWKQTLPPVFIKSSSSFSKKILQDISYLIQKYKKYIYNTGSANAQEL